MNNTTPKRKRLMRTFIDWLVSNDSWKGIAGILYFFICLFDFVILPIFVGYSRPSIIEIVNITQGMETEVALYTVQTLTRTHEPLTLMGGGLFHLAFGSILTGTVIMAGRTGTK